MPKKKANAGSSSSKPRPNSRKRRTSTPRSRPSISMTGSLSSKSGPSTSMTESSTSSSGPAMMAVPSTSKSEPSTLMAVPSTSKSGSSTSMAGLSTSKFGPSTSMAGPFTCMAVSSSQRSRSSASIARPSTPRFGQSYSPKRGPSTQRCGQYTSKSGPPTSTAGPSTSGFGPSTSMSGPSTSGFGTSMAGPSSLGFGPSTCMEWPSTSGFGPSYSPKRSPLTPKYGPYISIAGYSTPGSGPSTSEAGPSTPRSGPSKIQQDVPKGIKFMNVLKGREMGTLQPLRFIETAWQMKVEDFKNVASQRFISNTQNYLSHTTYFLRAGQNGLVAAWYIETKSGFKSAVSLLHYDLNRVARGNIGYVTSDSTIVDACQGITNPDYFIYICNDREGQGILNIVKPSFDDIRKTEIFPHIHPLHKPFNCCNANLHTEMFAVGLDREICVYSLAGLQELRLLRYNVYGLAYNKQGNLLYMGCANGKYVVYDLRAMDVVWRLKVDSDTIDDVQILSNEYLSLVSGPSGHLMKVDMRNNKKILDFPSHDRRSRKIPMSFNEKFEFVGCTGSDHLTRIWDLRKGNLLHSFGAPSTYPARSCFVPNSSKGQIHLVQDDYIHVYSMLR